MKLLLAPHFDDETLFAAFICLRERPFVAFCFDGAPRHGSFDVRYGEACGALRILGCEGSALRATPDTFGDTLAQLLILQNVEHVWAPWPEPGGNSEHNLVGDVASVLWPDRVSFYATYTDAGRTTTGDLVMPEPEWIPQKKAALACYRSQQRLAGMRPHFENPLPEYVIEPVEAPLEIAR